LDLVDTVLGADDDPRALLALVRVPEPKREAVDRLGVRESVHGLEVALDLLAHREVDFENVVGRR